MKVNTKIQNKRLLRAIQLKAFQLLGQGILSTKEYESIRKQTIAAGKRNGIITLTR